MCSVREGDMVESLTRIRSPVARGLSDPYSVKFQGLLESS